MKNTILSVVLFAAALFSASAFAQAPVAPAASKPLTIKGDLLIRYNTRTSGDKAKEGIADRYTMSINVADSAIFRGTIDCLPTIKGIVGNISQQGGLTYTMDLDIVNPANPAQTRNVGKLFGTIPIDLQNVYRFEDGQLKVTVFAMGSAKAFEGQFKGLAMGKPPTSEQSMFQRAKQEALNLTKQVQGKTVSIAVTKYDKMEFKDHKMASGPVPIYPETTVNGTFLYDYGRTAWILQDVTITYLENGRAMADKLSGSIRWVENINRKTTGEGEYQFDIRVNEPQANEANVFAGIADEAAFFSMDDAIPALTGVMKYKDSFQGETVTSSAVTVALVGNKLTKQQVVYLSKLLFLSSIVPLNAE